MSLSKSDGSDVYLAQLSAELSSLPKEAQTAILAEIHSHIEQARLESADTDTMLTELGDPSQLAIGMQKAYRPERTKDFLLCAVPTLLLPIIVGIGVARFYPIHEFLRFKQLWLTLLYLPFVVLSLRRVSVESQLFWLSVGILTLGAGVLKNPLLVGTKFGVTWIETIAYATLLVGVCIIFGRFLKQHLDDPLLMTWVSLLFALPLTVNGLQIFTTRLVGAGAYGEGVRLLAIVNLIATPIILALFFLPTKRHYRWGSLFLTVFIAGVSQWYLFWSDSILHPAYLGFVAILVVTLFAGLFRERNRHRLAIT